MKLILGFLCMVVLMGAVSVFSNIILKSSVTRLDNMIETVIIANRVSNSVSEIPNSLNQYFYGADAENKQVCVTRLAKIEQDMALLKKYINDEGGLDAWNHSNQLFDTFKENFNTTIDTVESQKLVNALDLLTQTKKAGESMNESIKGLILAELSHDSVVKDILNREVNQTGIITIIILLVICVVSAFGAVVFSNTIARMITSAVHQLNQNAQKVAVASTQLSAATQELSQGSSEQASAIEETSSVLQESASMLYQNAENTKQTAKLTEQTHESANKGNNEMNEMMNSIQEIKKSSDRIAKIIKVIDDIAFQTNILALNAAIEAARAGEAGTGFAVVAEEVRNLAGRSAQAAKDTAVIIESNIELSRKGVSVAERVQAALMGITANTKEVNELIEEISAASQEQSQGVEQVTKAMSQMETVTQRNAVNAEQSASISMELSSQAKDMKKTVYRLSQIVSGVEATLDKEDDQNEIDYPNKPIKAESNLSLSNEQDKRTKIITPEDVIQ